MPLEERDGALRLMLLLLRPLLERPALLERLLKPPLLARLMPDALRLELLVERCTDALGTRTGLLERPTDGRLPLELLDEMLEELLAALLERLLREGTDESIWLVVRVDGATRVVLPGRESPLD